MNQDQFWQLIEVSQDDDCEQQAANLRERLAALDADEIALFDRIFIGYYQAAYRWDLWAVAYIINGGCSDDAFIDFRYWLISKGRDFYEAALQNPELAADGVDVEDAYAGDEDFGYVAREAYKQATGKELPPGDYHRNHPEEPLGNRWTEDDLPNLYPALCKKFGC